MGSIPSGVGTMHNVAVSFCFSIGREYLTWYGGGGGSARKVLDYPAFAGGFYIQY